MLEVIDILQDAAGRGGRLNHMRPTLVRTIESKLSCLRCPEVSGYIRKVHIPTSTPGWYAIHLHFACETHGVFNVVLSIPYEIKPMRRFNWDRRRTSGIDINVDNVNTFIPNGLAAKFIIDAALRLDTDLPGLLMMPEEKTLYLNRRFIDIVP